MTQIILELSPELEAQIRAEANKQGLAPERVVLDALRSQLSGTQSTAPRLSHEESELLQHINLGIASDVWQEYYVLLEKREAEALTPDEQAQLIAISDRIEILNVARIQALIKLAALRNKSIETVMHSLGIQPPLHG